MRLCPICQTNTVVHDDGLCIRCGNRFKYRGFAITAGANGELNIGTINCFGCTTLSHAHAMIDRYLDGNLDPQCLKPSLHERASMPVIDWCKCTELHERVCIGNPIDLVDTCSHCGKPIQDQPAPELHFTSAEEHKSMTELAAEHPNLAEFLRELENRLEKAESFRLSLEDRYILAAMPIAYDCIKDQEGPWDADAYDYLGRLARRIAVKCMRAAQ